MSRGAIVLLSVLLASGTARADDHWYRGKYGRNRVTHLILTGTLGLGYLATVTVLSDTLSPDTCRWCEPPAFDRVVRNALVWKDTKRASLISDVDAFVVAPVVAIGLLVLSEKDTSASRLIDDVLPVLETVSMSQLLTNLVKSSVGRRRPYVEFGTATETSNEDNLSFWSGHSALGFAITTSAGLVAHWRHYRTEPYIWAAGITVSLSTEYLRMAADRHYLSDVFIGGLVGIGSGLLVPRLMRRELKIVPTGNGAALVGTF